MSVRPYTSIRALRQGEVLKLEGLYFKMDADRAGEEKEIRPGDMYIAERNTGPQLLVCKEICMPNWPYVLPTCNAYAYDLHECVRVVETDKHGNIL